LLLTDGFRRDYEVAVLSPPTPTWCAIGSALLKSPTIVGPEWVDACAHGVLRRNVAAEDLADAELRRSVGFVLVVDRP
jgi:hypothetical protein